METGGRRRSGKFGTYDTWVFNDEDFEWFVEPEGELLGICFQLTVRGWLIILLLVVVSTILHSRLTGVETWITSDGRAYFVRLNENEAEAESETLNTSPTLVKQEEDPDHSRVCTSTG